MKTKILLLLASLFFSFSVNAQIDFQPHVTVDDTGGTNGANSVFAADLDGDGDMDMLSSSRADSKIAWYENTNGSFGSQQIITENALGTNQVIAIDIDSDGDMDLINSTYGYGIYWYENTNGQGNFASPQMVSPSTVSASSILAKDMDGDNDLDIVANGGTESSIAWFENLDGQGTFGNEHSIAPSGASISTISVADLDGDGDMDVVAPAYYDEDIAWYENISGQGDFGPKQIITTNVSAPKGVSTADIDGDGDMDILATSIIFNNKVVWFENLNGQGSFGTERYVSSDVNGQAMVYTADLDDDGYVDVISGADIGGIIYWYRNLDGLGNFGQKQQITTTAESLKDLYFADLDNDSDLDVLSASSADDKIAYYKNTNGAGSFGPQQIVVEINGVNGPYTVNSADIDGDGDKDILSASSNGDKIAWQENIDGQGNFSAPKIISLQLDYPISINTADLDGDGDLDVISESLNDNYVAWFENLDGQGTFGSQQSILTIDGPAIAYPVDLNGDGDIDIVSAGNYGIYWNENLDGLGDFGAEQIVNQTISNIESLTATDLDDDGDMDIIAASWVDDVLVWFENDGQGNFGTQQTISTEISSSNSVISVDMDNDGDMDVLSSSFGDHSAVWFENIDGQGNFGALQAVNDNENGAFEVYVADLDTDGDMDVLTASYSYNTVFWYENQGSGNFGAEQVISSQVDVALCVFADDYNGDGKMDVLASSFTNDEIIWFENRGPLSIKENTTNLFSIYPNPTGGLLNIQSISPISEITIYNKIGQLLFTSEEKESVDISFLSQGIYFIKIVAENGQTETKKFVKK